ncbi:RrF2 family transcriptional regulator [Streptomyces alkaliterrae]|uniref:Rrf2 family transcriptional regulator n=1 Tax=Streptomyces alkaliterrae TaxID=2213162 RepID=A0A5P0YVL9_9ACTN|nr:Rrf2 family transcriptional regulator [Streptomyces alkaliterrae]MBB1261911.1 Rrf2 family transcriptional regulator [Streptomyces alkaliterrae]MQS04331.1 Rrf2 family transcriptional regulator [Streptomyces alkaliterrae]
MKMSNGVEWALHCCVSLSQATSPVPVARFAELHGVPTAYLAKQLQALSRAGIVRSVPGPSGGYRLTRAPSEITVLEVVEAVDGREPPFRCTEIRRRGPLALSPESCAKPCAVARAMASADAAWRGALADVTVADLGRSIDTDSSGTAMRELRGWLSGAG